MNAATLKGIRTVADEMTAGGCPVEVGDKVRMSTAGGHYVVRSVEFNQVIGQYVLGISADFRNIGRGVDEAVSRFPLSAFHGHYA